MVLWYNERLDPTVKNEWTTWVNMNELHKHKMEWKTASSKYV